MNTEQYRYIITVARTRNITRAAAELHISQPALTKAIRRQEEELGVALFHRDTTPLTLTYAGERYLAAASKLVEVEDSMRAELHDIAVGARERVRLGITVERGTAWLPLILPRFKREHPEVQVDVFEGVNAEFEKKLLANELDFCVSSLPLKAPELDYIQAGQAPVYLISSADHPLARYADPATNSELCPQYLPPRLLQGQKFITLSPGQGMYRVAKEIFTKYALRVKMEMQLSSQRTITLLAAAGMGLAFTTQKGIELARQETDLKPILYTVETPIYRRHNIIAYKKDRVFQPSVQALIDLPRSVMMGATEQEIVPRPFGEEDAKNMPD